MLIHAFILSLLLSLPTATLAFAFTSDALSSAWCVVSVASATCALCAYKEFRVMCAVVNGRVARARYVPIVRVIEHTPALAPAVPVAPVAKPVERTRFIPVRTHASYPSVPFQNSANQMFASEVTSPVLQTPTSHGVLTCDLIAFVNSLSTKGSHSRRAHEGRVMPSGRVIDAEYHALLCEPLVACGAITGRAPRKAGSLVMQPQEILVALGLT